MANFWGQLGVEATATASLANGTGRAGFASDDSFFPIGNLTGSGSADRRTGDCGANRIDGGAGNDKLTGSVGNDTLLGGSRFVGSGQRSVRLVLSGGDTRIEIDQGNDCPAEALILFTGLLTLLNTDCVL